MDLPLLLCIGFLTLLQDGEGAGTKAAHCRFERVHGMLGADCRGLNFPEVPQVTRPVEVLDASVNRIRSLKNDSFLTYESVRYLYLFDNSIAIIEFGAFDPLVVLEVLDLHVNAIREVPPILPPLLRKLNLADNVLGSRIPLDKAESIAWLSLAGNRLMTIPDTGLLPQLNELNMTDNPIQVVTVSQLAKYCLLENLRLPSSLMTTSYINTCDCVRVNTWILKNSIYVDPQFNCTVMDESECLANGSADAQSAYAACKVRSQEIKWTRNNLLLIGAAGLILLFVMAVLLYFLWRRRYSKPRSPPSQPSAEEVRKMKLLKRSRSFTRASFRPSKSTSSTSRTSNHYAASSKKPIAKTTPNTVASIPSRSSKTTDVH